MTKENSDRITVRLPEALAQEVDRIVKKFPMYGNRQQFVEGAVREKIEKLRQFEAVGLQSSTG
jgi:metal-responsive CopG/Arc/MetJ family transcriptional regulator